jgi:hypothetical protein
LADFDGGKRAVRALDPAVVKNVGEGFQGVEVPAAHAGDRGPIGVLFTVPGVFKSARRDADNAGGGQQLGDLFQRDADLRPVTTTGLQREDQPFRQGDQHVLRL